MVTVPECGVAVHAISSLLALENTPSAWSAHCASKETAGKCVGARSPVISRDVNRQASRLRSTQAMSSGDSAQAGTGGAASEPARAGDDAQLARSPSVRADGTR